MKSIKEIKSVLEELSRLEISYVLLRNYAFLFDKTKTPGKDVDIAVKKEEIDKIQKVLTERSFFQQKICPYSKHIGFYKFIKEDDKLIKFHFHIDGVSGRHLIYLPLNNLIKNRIFIKKIPVISREDTLLSLALHSNLGEGSREDYINKVKEILSKDFDKKYVKQSLEEILDQKIVQKFLTLLYSQKFKELDIFKSRIKKKVITKNHRTILDFLKIRLPCILWKIKEIIKGAPVISFIGMDGSGKTTLSTKILETLSENKIKTQRIYTGRGKNNLLPIQRIGRPYKRLEKKVKINSILIKVIYTVSSIFFFLDFLFRYFFFIYPAKLRNKIVLTDRYSSDVLLMKNVPTYLKKAYYLLLPKPTLTFYVYNNIETLHKRKPGHPFEDLQRQEKLFERINKKINPIKIKNENLDQSRREILTNIFNKIRI